MRGLALIAAIFFACTSAAAAADEAPICPDRPSKSTGPCTVPEGRWQIETGLVDWSHSSAGGIDTDALVWGNSAIKYGIGPHADVELWLTPLEGLSVHGNGQSAHDSSFGDTLVRVKYALTRDGAPVQIAVDPFVKIPTANRRLGNGKVEAGLVVPVQLSLGKSPFSISLDPELDLLADGTGTGDHAAMIQLVNLGWQASERLALTTELWGQWNFDPAGTTRQSSWDVSIAYLPKKNLQLDAGANFGLNRQTSDFELYTGISVRF